MNELGAALATVDSWQVPAVAAAIVGPDGILETHGDIDARFALASVTKPLAVLAMLVAVEEEAISLTQDADADVIPGATVRHLLAHASGLAPERLLRSFAPAQRRVYSNVGIEVAAAQIEAAVGIGFDSYFDEALVRPLRLTATSLPGSPARAGISSVRDLAQVIHAVLTPAGFLHQSTLQDATSVQYPGLRGVLPGFGNQDGNDWGLGFEIRGHKSPHWTGSANTPEAFGHFGQSGTMFWVEPELGIGLVSLTDRPFDAWARQAWPQLSDAVLAAV